MATTIGIPTTTVPRMSPAGSGEQIASAAAPAPAKRERLVSLDVFRGLTIAAMLLVDNPGTWDSCSIHIRELAGEAVRR